MHPWLTPVCRTSLEVNRSRGGRLPRYVEAVGTLFALVTGPGPLLHNTLVGQGTPLADAATPVFGHEADIAAHREHAHEQSALSAGILQVAVGVPSYSLLTLASVSLSGRQRRSVGGTWTGRPSRAEAARSEQTTAVQKMNGDEKRR